MLLAIILLVYLYIKREGVYLGIIKGILIWTSILLILTEILSLIALACRQSLCISWTVIDIALIILTISQRKSLFKTILIEHDTLWYKLLFAVIFVITVYLAIKTAPYNWDSMTYHLPRIMQWSQNQSVAHFATHNIRQITSPVLAEFIGLHIYLISGHTDAFLNVLQWTTYVINTVIIVGISHQLCNNKKLSYLAGFLYICMPIAFAESLTTQNDSLSTMWLLFFTYLIQDMLKMNFKLEVRKDTISRIVYMGLTIGFAYLTKPNVLIAMFFFLVLLLIVCIRRKDKLLNMMKLLLCGCGTIGIVILPEVIRNYISFHALSDSMAGTRQIVGRINPKYLFVNFLKNFFFNAPNIYIEDLGPKIQKGIYALSKVLNVNINEESISEGGREFCFHASRTYDHDMAINPVIFWGSLMLFFISFSCMKDARKKKYCNTVMSSFVFLCMIVRWEPFVTRYMLPFLALLCPAISCMLEELMQKKRFFSYAIVGTLIFASTAELYSMIRYHWDIANYASEDRQKGNYYHKEALYNEDRNICNYIISADLQTIGLITGSDNFEYPIWAMLKGEVEQISHVFVDNVSGKYENINYIPDAIWVRDYSMNEIIQYHEKKYLKWIDCNDGNALYIREELCEK